MSGLLAELVVADVVACFLVFARIGTAMMILPMFGEPWLTMRGRLVMALVTAFVLVPASGVQAPPVPDPARMFVPVVSEMAVGAFLGLLVRSVFAALHVAGATIAMHAGLQVASMFDPNEATQSTIPSILLSTTILTLMFAADAHHLLLAGLARSYEVLPFGLLPDAGYLSEAMTRAGSRAFDLAFRVAGPVILVALLLNAVLGVMNRMMPTLQVLFIAAPLQIMVGLLVLAAALGSIGSLSLRFVALAWTDVLGDL
ncbi:flagellar biosynthetic protein FliR [Geminicoccus roseus]|uniref:flagellar biosynthetic protein FliR n=1 Tax=Geminicoccus roseus TaxID=404900 RepID=UPI0003F67346|nr:flagellar biosynthetic protein FliR [Geminicoccus roseus]